MASKLREIEEEHDTKATVRDIIAAYGQDSPPNREETTYQWNNFVRDFRQDPISKQYTAPLKVASLLWQQVRDSDQAKKYRSSLIIENEQLLLPYHK
ncbi:hypothetical protein KIM322_03190 [Lactobacillus xylocopicola]|uniref:Uncharacterized protein n=1 Tax=Lactobacillus xylocopicola TaxID=2976676 RepID=A0ABN6SKB8_9LACO|nr:hypothetical protein KIM322_03190 [Lactobacillus xylocopicola]